MQSLPRYGRTDARELVALALIVAFASYGLAWTAQRTFDFYDMSFFLDAGYRTAIGQEPYVDFYYTAGPMHLWMHAFFFRLFGFTKAAVLSHLLSVNATVTLIAWAWARRSLSRIDTILVTALAALSFYGQVAHPWYDHNAHFWIIIAIWLADLYADRTGWAGRTVSLLSGVLVALAFFTKANIGAAGAMVVAAYWIFGARRPRALIPFSIGIVLATAGLCAALQSPSEMYFQNFVMFKTMHRLIFWPRLWFVLVNLPFSYLGFLGFLLLLRGGWEFAAAQSRRVVRCGGLIFASIFAAYTGSLAVIANAPLLGFVVIEVMGLAAALRDRAEIDREIVSAGLSHSRFGFLDLLNPLLRATVVILVANFAYDMSRVTPAWDWHAGTRNPQYQLRTPAFAGWRCETATGMGVDYAVTAIQKYVGPDERICIIPNPTFLYGLAGVKSYSPAPFLFHPYQIPTGHCLEEFHRRFVERPPEWVLLHIEHNVPWGRLKFILPWMGIERFLVDQYRAVEEWGDFLLLHRGPEGADWSHYRAKYSAAAVTTPVVTPRVVDTPESAR